jgi:peptidyl-tRNA hydrolase
MYAILRSDLRMSSGKAAAMASHAILDSFLQADEQSQHSYLNDGGTKVVLAAKDELELHQLERLAHGAGIPFSLVTESHHVHPPDFDGSPIIVALGLGPVERG